MLRAIQGSRYPELSLQEVSRIVFESACREKSIGLLYTDRLEKQVFKYVKQMIYIWTKAKRRSSTVEEKFVKRIAEDCNLWRCKVLAEEFEDMECFRNMCLEHEMYEANRRKAGDSTVESVDGIQDSGLYTSSKDNGWL